MEQPFNPHNKDPDAPLMFGGGGPMLYQPQVHQQQDYHKNADAPDLILDPNAQYNSNIPMQPMQIAHQQGLQQPMMQHQGMVPQPLHHQGMNQPMLPMHQQQAPIMGNSQFAMNPQGGGFPMMQHPQTGGGGHGPIPVGGPSPVSGPVAVQGGSSGGEPFKSHVLKKDLQGRWYATFEDDNAGRTLLILAVAFMIAAVVALPVGIIVMTVGIVLVAAVGQTWAVVFIALGGAAMIASGAFVVVVISTSATGLSVTALRATFDTEGDLLLIHYVNQVLKKECCGCCGGCCDEIGVKDEVKLSHIREFDRAKPSGLKRMFGGKDRLKCVMGDGKTREVGMFAEAKFAKMCIPAMNEFLKHKRGT